MQHRCTYVDKKSVTSCFALFLSIVSSTIGIECSKWVCLKKKAQTKITFYTWDFAGQVSGLCMGCEFTLFVCGGEEQVLNWVCGLC